MSTVVCLQLGIMEFAIKHLLDSLATLLTVNYTSMEMSRLTQCIIYIYNCSSYMLYIKSMYIFFIQCLYCEYTYQIYILILLPTHINLISSLDYYAFDGKFSPVFTDQHNTTSIVQVGLHLFPSI